MSSGSEGAAAGEGAAPHGAVYVDPLGLLLFGPTAGAELGLGAVSIGLYGRWLNGGLVARQLFEKPQEHETFAFSYGVGLRGRYYFSEPLAGPFAGLTLELLQTRMEREVELAAVLSSYFVPMAEAGYRLRFGSFFVTPTAALGYAFQVSHSVENLPGGTRAGLMTVKDESTVYGTAALELGVYF